MELFLPFNHVSCLFYFAYHVSCLLQLLICNWPFIHFSRITPAVQQKLKPTKAQTASLEMQTLKVPDLDTQNQVYTKHDIVCADKDSLPKICIYLRNDRELALWKKTPPNKQKKILVCQLQAQSV